MAAAAVSARKPKEPKSPISVMIQKDTKAHVDPNLVEKAATALIRHHNATTDSSKSLLGTDTAVQVCFALEVAPVRSSSKPIRIEIPHPIHKVSDDDDGDDGLEEPEVCLIVKEESKPWVQEMIQQFPAHMGYIKKVLGLQSLRNKHARFQQRRELLHKYDVFMADDRILPMLTKALGKDFFKAKKQPIPVALTRKEALPFAIRKSLQSTFMTVPAGTCVTIKAGNTGMPVRKLADNVVAIAAHAVLKLPRKWANIRSICIKTPYSTALPVYNKTPAELMEIAAAAGLSAAWNDDNKQEDVDLDQDKEQSAAKRKLTTKSPLLRALKKQKQQGKESASASVENDTYDEDDKADLATKKKTSRKRDTKDSDEDKTNHSQPKERRDDKMQKKRKGRGEKNSKATDEASDVVKKKRTVAKSEKLAKKKKAEEEQDSKDEGTVEKSNMSGRKSFIASKKFKGSKKGYAFRNGKDGVGYYVDVKPVVDKMALEAIFRMAEQQNSKRAGGRRKSGGKGKRRSKR